jgi:hypothetical protein
MEIKPMKDEDVIYTDLTAIRILTEMITSKTTPDEALKYTQAALNLAHAEATLANMRK